ncbi:tyrosine-type recombinase/integrase [Paludisphaera soli]|uniref:tyrosine-type recombinase/integrase n=1 Tax=Paludisphaera soli TaxID=2712865 RepID=UPI0013ED4C0B|nr:site-specific integrase [Paludisphaera soli]
MASLEERSGRFRVIFRHGGRKFQHSLGTRDRREAEACLVRLEENLRLLERGRLTPPPGADLPLFLLSDGKLASRAEAARALTLAELFDRYLSTRRGVLEDVTLATIGTHLGHLTTTLGAMLTVESLTASDLQRHIERRTNAKGVRGRPLSPTTMKKEISSFSAVWTWANQMGLVAIPFPSKGLAFPKSGEKPSFQTRAEIERQIERGRLAPRDQDDLWACLYLTLPEVEEVLEHVRSTARHAFIYPMFVFAAHTGARRSEILRSRIADFDFEAGTAVIREKKRVKGRWTTRRVPLSPRLAGVMRDWFAAHPGGAYTISREAGSGHGREGRPEGGTLTRDESNHHFHRALAESRWSVIRGWHVFRHSFASNCAARGVDQRLIDAWMGHQTEEMRRRYRHLSPDQQADAIRSVFTQR